MLLFIPFLLLMLTAIFWSRGFSLTSAANWAVVVTLCLGVGAATVGAVYVGYVAYGELSLVARGMVFAMAAMAMAFYVRYRFEDERYVALSARVDALSEKVDASQQVASSSPTYRVEGEEMTWDELVGYRAHLSKLVADLRRTIALNETAGERFDGPEEYRGAWAKTNAELAAARRAELSNLEARLRAAMAIEA